MLDERGFPAGRLKVMLNRVPEKGTPDRAGIESLIGRPIAATFRNDYMALYDAYSEGNLLQQGSPLAKQFLALANSISARAAGEPETTNEVRGAAPPVPETGKRWFSFFQRAQA
jgi:Flp pilus assembly CpaE family ATPase